MEPRTCSVEGCEQEVVAKGWCNVHYKRWHRHGNTDKYKPGAKSQHENGLVICSTWGCNLPARTRGFCSKHHMQQLSWGYL